MLKTDCGARVEGGGGGSSQTLGGGLRQGSPLELKPMRFVGGLGVEGEKGEIRVDSREVV